MAFATTANLVSRWRTLTSDELTQAALLLDDVSDALRVYAYDRGIDLDEMLEDFEPRKRVAMAVVCDIVKREMCSNSDGPAMSQTSQSALGYTVSGTFLSPGGGLFIKNSELKQLGLMKQKVKMVEA